MDDGGLMFYQTKGAQEEYDEHNEYWNRVASIYTADRAIAAKGTFPTEPDQPATEANEGSDG